VAGGVQSLVGLGAKNIVVAGLPNLGATARSVALGSTAQAFGLRVSSAFNAELRTRLGAIAASAPAADVNLVYIDVQSLLDRVILDFRALGFSNTTSFAIAPASAGVPRCLNSRGTTTKPRPLRLPHQSADRKTAARA
jgi:phospholipase/lecithinase/hemolysin